MRVFIAVIVLIFSLQSWTKADDIQDFEIEGMSIGDSLLDYLTKEEINNKIDSYSNKGFIYKNKDYYALTFQDPFILQNYKLVQFHLKNNDKKYIIHSVSGINELDIKKCYSQFDSIENELDIIFKNSKKNNKQNRKHLYDKSGKSITTDVYYYLSDGSTAAIVCTDWSDAVIKENKGWSDHLRLKLNSAEFQVWLDNKAYK